MSALVLGHRLVAYVAPFQVGGQIRVRHTGCHSRRRPSFAHAATLPATTHHANPCVRALLETSTRSYPPYYHAPPARSYDWGGGLSVGAAGQARVKLHADVATAGSVSGQPAVAAPPLSGELGAAQERAVTVQRW